MPSNYDGRGDRNEGAYKLYSFGEYIKKLRKEKGWTQKQVAERMGLPNSQKVCDMEAGRKFSRRINIELLKRVATAFDVPIADVFARVQYDASLFAMHEVNKRVDFVLLLIRQIFERLEKIEQCQASTMEEVTEMKERISFILLENI